MLFPNLVGSQTPPSLCTKSSNRTVVLLVSVKREEAGAKQSYTTTLRKRTFGHVQPNCNDVILSNVTCSGRTLRSTNLVNSLGDYACVLQSIPGLSPLPCKWKGLGTRLVSTQQGRSISINHSKNESTLLWTIPNLHHHLPSHGHRLTRVCRQGNWRSLQWYVSKQLLVHFLGDNWHYSSCVELHVRSLVIHRHLQGNVEGSGWLTHLMYS